MSAASLLKVGAAAFDLTLTPAQLDAFEQYAQALVEWNQRSNLTRITDPAEIAVKHFLDSLSVYPLLPPLPLDAALIDIGTGPGFPGLPIKIVRPELRLSLVESVGKKTAFLHHIVESLGLHDVKVITARAEDVGRQADHRERYDVAVARAVTAMQILAEYTLPLLKIGGRVIAQKGQSPAKEVDAADRAIKLLGGQLEAIRAVTVPYLSAERHVVCLRKVSPTPKQFPRRSGLPAKRPL